MELWHPRATIVAPSDGHTGLSFDGALTKGVIHTTEAKGLYRPNTSTYFGNPYWPNATIDTARIYQHIPANLGAYALAHEYGSDTNRADAIQCEVMWNAADGDWPDALLANLADWISWVSGPSVADVPLVFAEMFREGVTVASVDSPIRFGDAEWYDYHGWCGHSNIPGGNDHWDPGRLPVDRLKTLLIPTPIPQPSPQEALTMQRQLVNNGADYLWLGPERIFTRITTGGVFDVLKAGNDVPRVEVDDATLTAFRSWATNAKFTG